MGLRCGRVGRCRRGVVLWVHIVVAEVVIVDVLIHGHQNIMSSPELGETDLVNLVLLAPGSEGMLHLGKARIHREVEIRDRGS